jgi:small-conductance mechanosensitive channel
MTEMSIGELLWSAVPSAATIAAVVVGLVIVNRVLQRGGAGAAGHKFRNQVIMLALTAVGLLVVILVVPIGDARRGQLLNLVGILMTAAIALSATTFVGNAMAGIMLKAVRSFRLGDFIKTGEHFGRVSERGLFHTEIQTEFRDLTTLPNLYLVTHPVTTIRSSGTFVRCEVSLGYDVPRTTVEKLLLQAAEQAKLAEPYVQVISLGDFSVVYRVAGLLTEVKLLLTTRSRLRCKVLDCLHEGGVEIVSPNFMNQRVLSDGKKFVPRTKSDPTEEETGPTPEEIAFDKADAAESTEQLRETYKAVQAQIEELEAELAKGDAGEEKVAADRIEREISILNLRKKRLERMLEKPPEND